MKLRIQRALALLLSVLIAAPAGATNYYVSDQGDDGNSCNTASGASGSGNQHNDKRNPASGAACLSAGDTLYIRDNGVTYTGSLADIDTEGGATLRSGTSGAHITITGYPGEHPVIKPNYGVSAVRFYQSKSYIDFMDLKFDMSNCSNSGCTAEGIIIYLADHITFNGVDLYGGYSFGFHIGDNTPHIEVRNSQIHGFGSSASIAGDAHALYITGSDGIYENNEVYDVGGYGFHVYNNDALHPDEPSRNIVRNNIIHGTGISLHGTSYGLVIGFGDSNVAYNNIIYGNQGGVQLYTKSTNTVLANNTVYGNSFIGLIAQFYCAGVTVRNNIVYGNGEDGLHDGGPHDTCDTATVTADHNLYTNPNFTSSAGHDFTLQVGSGGIDTGTTVADVTTDYIGTSRPRGLGYDIGAYEAIVVNGRNVGLPMMGVGQKR